MEPPGVRRSASDPTDGVDVDALLSDKARSEIGVAVTTSLAKNVRHSSVELICDYICTFIVHINRETEYYNFCFAFRTPTCQTIAPKAIQC